ncbi:MAG: MFS transporter [Gaiellales bacterium]
MRKPGRLPPTRVVSLAVFAAALDSYLVPPMLLAIAADFDRSLSGVAAVAALYSFAYGLMQLGWGLVSNRLGRLGAVRVGLAIGAVATFTAAFAGDLTLLLVLRAIAGAAFAAVAPSTITFIGDHVEPSRRAATLSDLVAVYSAGVAAGILCGGLASDLATWRVGFLASAAMAALALATQLRYARDPVRERQSPRAYAASISRCLRSTWPRAVALLALVEGAALIGFLTFFPAALEDSGVSRRLAGLVVALYGVAIALGSRPIRRLVTGWPAGRIMALGLLLGALSLAVAAVSQTPVAIGCAAVLLAAGFALAHPLLQAWATEVSTRDRATTVALFATGLFVGTAITTQVAAPFVSRFGFGWTFAFGGVLAAGLALTVAATRARYERAAA